MGIGVATGLAKNVLGGPWLGWKVEQPLSPEQDKT